YAAGYVAARKYNAEIVDPRPYATEFFRKIYTEYPHMGSVVPSTGYRLEQLRELEEFLNRIPADTVVLATPSDITRLIRLNKPVARVSYKLEIVEGPRIKDYIDMFLEKSSRRLM
ncbi:MAG: GTPase, partial [Desulfurococcaceae archaeon]